MRVLPFSLGLLVVGFLVFSIYSIPDINYEKEMPGAVEDNTDNKAAKEIKSNDIKNFETMFVYSDGYGEANFYQFTAQKSSDAIVEIQNSNSKMMVESDFLVKLQEIIKSRDLAKKNGTNHLTKGLPYEPTFFKAEYESSEIISFHEDAQIFDEWKGDIVELFLDEFAKEDITPINADIARFSYSYSGMMLDDIYDFDIQKNADDYTLICNFFDPENSYESVEAILEGQEHRDFCSGIYDELTRIYQVHEIYRWNNFKKTRDDAVDGYIFSLNITFENDEELVSYGSNASPNNFGQVKEDIENLMKRIMSYAKEYV